VQLSHIPEYFMGGIIPCDVVFLQVSPPNQKGEYSFCIANDFTQFATQKARTVIAEVNDQMPWVYCDRTLTEKDFTHIVRTSRPLVEHKASPIGPVEEVIARNVGRCIDDGMTVQIGIGAIPDAIMAGQGAVVARVFDESSAGFHQPLLQAGQRPGGDPSRQRQPPPQVPQVIGDDAQPQSHLVGPKAVAGKSRH